MSAYRSALLAIEVMSVLIVLLLLNTIYLNPRRTEKRRRLLITLSALLFWLIGETVTGLVMEKNGTGMMFLAHISQYVILFNVIILFPCYQRFLRTENTTGNGLHDGSRPLLLGIYGVSLILFLLACSNPVTHIFFRIRRDIGFVPGPMRKWVDYLLIIQCVLILFLVRYICRKYSYPKCILHRVMICTLFPVLSVMINIVTAMRVISYSVIHLMIVVMIYTAYINFYLEMERNEQKTILRLKKSRTEHLTWQIHPHFLFNSLVVIKELCSIDSKRAEEALQNFADYLRDNLDAMESYEPVPFSRELQMIDHYIALEKADPTRQFDIIYDLQVTDFMLPILSVEPLVENAIRHGIKGIERGAAVWIRTWRERDIVFIEVCDNGSGIRETSAQTEERKSIGLDNVRERLEMQCGGKMKIESSADGTCVTLMIPWQDPPGIFRESARGVQIGKAVNHVCQ